jgi:hypothetical protein
MSTTKLNTATAPEQTAEAAVQTKQAGAGLKESLAKLAKAGGFTFLESCVDGIANVNPERKARKEIFLNDSDKKKERDDLQQTLALWIDILSSGSDTSQMAEKCKTSSEAAEQSMKENLKQTLEATRALETAYRTVAQFYSNTESDKVKNVVVLNASLDQMKDLNNTYFIDYVAAELKENYDRLDLRDNYSLLAIPGYLGSNKVLEKWAKIANENKVMLVTDFINLDKPDDVVEMFENANLTGGELHRSNVIMTCNYIVGRGKEEEIGEEEDVFLPPSSSLAGKMHYTLMSQVTAGKKHGSMNEVDAVRFKLKKSEISHLEKIGLVPMVSEYGKVMAFSAKTLFNGDNIGLQTYSVVRVFDYVTKVLFDFLNRRAFENWNSKTEADLRTQIIDYLDSIKGPGRLIEKFKITRFEQDEKDKDRIWLDIHLTPYFPAKSFVIKLDGHKGDDGNEWNSEYEQS